MILGDIQFLNSWPVTHALRRGIVGGSAPAGGASVPGFILAPPAGTEPGADVHVVTGTPAELNRRLLTGELDAGAVSSLLYLRYMEEFVAVPGLCIRSDSPVHSVLVVSYQPLTTLKGRTVGVSNQGATTPVLLRILAAQRQLKINLEMTPLRYPEILQEYPAALLIGDEALQASQSADGLQWWDLGEAWTAWTRRPFVYALWVMRRSLAEKEPLALEGLTAALRASYEWGKAHRDEMIAAMRKVFPFEATFLRRYLQGISYQLDARAWAGLHRFAREAERIGELPRGTARRMGAAVRRGQAIGRPLVRKLEAV